MITVLLISEPILNTKHSTILTTKKEKKSAIPAEARTDATVKDLGECIVFMDTMIFLQYFKVYRENRCLNTEAWSKASDPNWPHSPKQRGSLKYFVENFVVSVQ